MPIYEHKDFDAEILNKTYNIKAFIFKDMNIKGIDFSAFLLFSLFRKKIMEFF